MEGPQSQILFHYVYWGGGHGPRKVEDLRNCLRQQIGGGAHLSPLTCLHCFISSPHTLGWRAVVDTAPFILPLPLHLLYFFQVSYTFLQSGRIRGLHHQVRGAALAHHLRAHGEVSHSEDKLQTVGRPSNSSVSCFLAS